MRLRTLAVSGFIASAALAGCSDFGPEDVVGIYDLISVDDAGVPNLVELGADTVAILSGWMQLNANSTCTSGIVVLGGSLVASCTYRLDGQDITLTNEQGEIMTGRTDGVTLLLTDELGVRWRFRD